MKRVRHCTPERLSALKTATGNLVAHVGGGLAWESVTRVHKSQLSDYANPHKPESFMPVDVLVDLVARAPEPALLREIALLSGYTIVPIEPADETELAAAIAESMREGADVSVSFLDGLADGGISPANALDIAREADEAAESHKKVARIASALARKTITSSPGAPAPKGEGPSAASPMPPSGRGGRVPRRRQT